MSTFGEWDVVIVGAGLAGSAAAAVLARKGIRVALVDARDTYPTCFKAEKIEPDQAELLRRFGLLQGLIPFSSRIHEVISARNDVSLRTLRLEQYGIFYHDMVNGVRRQMPSSVTTIVMRVREIVTGPDGACVKLVNGQEIKARVAALACGTGGQLHAALGMSKSMMSEKHSLAIGFNVERNGSCSFPFEALTYYSDGFDGHTAFLTLFPIREVMRANYFVYRTPEEEWVRRFTKNPREQLLRSLPKLEQFTGPITVSSRVEMSVIDLYKLENYVQPGIVALGDTFQSVCPTSGMGVSKVLTDVDAFCELVPEWLKTPGMDPAKIAQYYNHPRKLACDRKSMQKSLYARRLATKPSIGWAFYRELYFLGMRVQGQVTDFLPGGRMRVQGAASS